MDKSIMPHFLAHSVCLLNTEPANCYYICFCFFNFLNSQFLHGIVLCMVGSLKDDIFSSFTFKVGIEILQTTFLSNNGAHC